MKIYHCSICGRITASLIETLTTKPMCPDCWSKWLEVCHKPLTDCMACDKCREKGETKNEMPIL